MKHGRHMPEKETLQRAGSDRAQGKSPSTQAGEFIREEMHHRRQGKHSARAAAGYCQRPLQSAPRRRKTKRTETRALFRKSP